MKQFPFKLKCQTILITFTVVKHITKHTNTYCTLLQQIDFIILCKLQV